MADVIDFTKKGRRPKADADPDREMAEHGLRDEQTDLLKRPVRVGTRAEAATALRVTGASYAEIADVLEFASAFEARRAVESILAATIDESRDYLALRALEGLRLEGLYRSVIPRALDEQDPDQLGFHRAALSVLDRIAKLHGLDAPQRLEVINPGAEEFDKVLQAMRAASGRGDPEPDLFELEGEIEAEWEEGDDGDTGLEGSAGFEAGSDPGDEPVDRVPDEPED